jgi:16S rRNA (cytidine1402-2'-O)-methyltransferase
MKKDPSLYLVPTPIGNLKDITIRAIEVLQRVDCIYAEDTRTSSRLLKEHNVATPVKSYHIFNEHKLLAGLIEKLKNYETIALITDAGTPGISDPGFLLVRACLDNDIKIECLPGATALIPALVNSGFPSDRFVFEGFLPHKKGRKKRIELLADEPRTIILYESPHRLLKTLIQLKEVMGNERRVSVSRELSKLHEENIRGTFEELILSFENRSIKGEIVIVIENKARN